MMFVILLNSEYSKTLTNQPIFVYKIYEFFIIDRYEQFLENICSQKYVR